MLGDAHFGAEGQEQEEKKTSLFISLLDEISANDAELIICGDLFDFWFEYKHAVPRLHYRILRKLSNLTDAGVPIHYLAGNHDFWLDSFISQEIGLIIHPDEYELSYGNFKLYMLHGDGLLSGDHLYRLLKKVLRHPINIFLYRLLHPDVGIPLALFFSHWSRNSQKRDDYSDEDYRQFARDKIEGGYDIVVLGHTHWPALEPYRTGWYLNPGAWMYSFTFAVIDDDGPALYQWDGEKAHEYHPELPPGNVRAKGERP